MKEKRAGLHDGNQKQYSSAWRMQHGYGAYYMPSLAYCTPATTLSYKECEDVQRALAAVILPKMGIVRNAARKVVFGSAR
jgi:hypothetical protein